MAKLTLPEVGPIIYCPSDVWFLLELLKSKGLIDKEDIYAWLRRCASFPGTRIRVDTERDECSLEDENGLSLPAEMIDSGVSVLREALVF